MSYTIDRTYTLGANEGDSRKANNLYIIVHETDNATATGANEASFMKRNWRKAYTTDIVGDGKVYRVGEWGYRSYGALDANPDAPVQIELQHTLDKALFKKNYAIYIELIRDACDKYNIPKKLDIGGVGVKGVKSHKWVSDNIEGNHQDPYSYLQSMGISKSQFAKDIENGIGTTEKPTQEKETDNLSVNIEKALSKAQSLKGKLTYSMYGSRTGADGSADCSGFVYTCIRAGGGSNYGYVPSTETLHDYLKKNGFKLIAENKGWTMKRGDVVIWGKRGFSSGSFGHTGICVDGNNWYECTAWAGGGNSSRGGVILSNHDSRLAMNGYPYWYVYRLSNSSTSKPSISKPSTSTKSKTTFANGSKVKVRSSATKYQTGQSIPASIKGKTYTVQQRKTVNQSKSVYAFLLKEIMSWVLAQDLEAVKTTTPKPTTSTKPKDWSKDYYTTNPKKVKLLKDDGLYGKSDVDFKKGVVGGHYKKGTQFTITGIKTRKDGLPRLVTQSGFLLTANKKYVEKLSTSTGYTAKKVGQVVTVQSKATKYQTGQSIPSFVKGKKYVVEQVKNVSQSNSKRAYLLGNGLNSWVLEQDVK